MSREKEIWKEFPLDYEIENNYRLEVSNLGNVRSFNSHFPDGRIITGSLQGGFPIVRIKLFRKRSERDQQKIDELQQKIDELNSKIKVLGYTKSNAVQKADLRAKRDKLVQKRKNLNHRIDKKRVINLGILKHKAVAELFLDKPKNKKQKFIIHKDFDKENNSVGNLAWASQEELNVRYQKHPKNILFAFRKQFMEDKPLKRGSKLSENDVLIIKKRLKRGDALKKLASRFNVSEMQIHRIKTGENWSHVKLLEDILDEKKK